MAISIILILSIHEHGRSFHLLLSALISFFIVLYFYGGVFSLPWLRLFLDFFFFRLFWKEFFS
jgi:hypothetical protein